MKYIPRFIFLLIIGLSSGINAKLPNFEQYHDVKLKKQNFFDFLYPLAQKANHHVQIKRNKLIALKQHKQLSNKELEWLKRLSVQYKVPANLSSQPMIEALLNKIDIIPNALLLAQAANESAWGTSRFAKLANNLFGQWCYSKNCGLIPKKRGKNQHHQVQSFDSVYQSIEAYLFNLNQNSSYRLLRNIRHDLRKNHQKITGTALASGLVHYSERGLSYVNDIKKMILINNLEQYDQ